MVRRLGSPSNKKVYLPDQAYLVIFGCLLTLCTGFAQQRPSSGSGLVTGRITCADTGAPARFVHVVLVPLSSPPGSSNQTQTQTQTRLESTTDRDGVILFSNVAAGAYFIDVSLAGYLQPLHLVSPEALQSKDPQRHKLVLDRIPNITVENGASAPLAVALERGAVLSGEVSYDDSAPIENVSVTATRVKVPNIDQGSGQSTTDISNFQARVATDDRGMYRISGLPPGAYIVSARISENHLKVNLGPGNAVKLATTQPGDVNLTFYASSSVEKSKAQEITLVQGDEKQGVDLTVDLTALRSVSGVVHHQGTPIQSAGLELKDRSDPENRHGTVTDEKGFFRFDLLPQGNYTLMAYPPQPDTPDGATERKPSLSVPVAIQNRDISDLSIDLANPSH